jgi:DnaK suppressor protein
LAQHRERIERALAGRTRTEDGEPDEQPVDGDTSLHDEEVEGGVAEDLRETLAAIGRAEKRLEQGTYGISIESGEPIPDARLETIPWAERTADEQRHHELHR